MTTNYYPQENKYADMEQKPDQTEKKQLRRYYFRLSFIMIIFMLVFSGINILVKTFCAGIAGGGFTKEIIAQGTEIIRSNPIMSAIYSYAFPLAADIAAFGTGLIITKANIKEKLKFSGFTGGDLCGFTACSFTAAAIGSFVMMILYAIIMLMAGRSNNLGSAQTALDAVSVVKSANPLWLEILIYLYVCLIGPVMEELVFRGVLLEGLRKYGNRFGIIMSSVLFGLMHQNFVQCIPAIFLGIVFASMTVRTGSLIPSITVHIINNSLSAVLMIYMHSVDMTKLTNALETGVNGMASFDLSSYSGLIAIMLVYMLFRVICCIGAVIVTVKYFGNRGKLIPSDKYCTQRTWGYLFTSVPWLFVIGYLLVCTVTSVL
ncbi:MAG: lysostaphin resistance A-like protein [Huintestinicola sp.]